MFHMSREIYDQVEALAHLIMQSPEYQAMKQAEAESQKDGDLSACRGALEKAQEKLIAASTQEGEKDLDHINGLIREIEELNLKMYTLPAYAAMAQARKPFQQLMQGVVEVLQNVVEPDIQCSCSGNCAECGGCGQN